jgi:hypothetical protein
VRETLPVPSFTPFPQTPQGRRRLLKVTAGCLLRPGSAACHRPFSSSSLRRSFPLDCLPSHGAIWYFSSSSHLVSPRFKGLEDFASFCLWDDYISAICVSSILWNHFGANFRAKPCLLCLTSGCPESPVLTHRILWSLRPCKVGDRRLRCRSTSFCFGSAKYYFPSSGHVFDSSLATLCPSLSQVAVQVVVANVSLGSIPLTTTRPKIAM